MSKLNLLDDTLRMAAESGLSAPALAAKAGVEVRWMYMILADQIPDPSVRKIQRVYDALAHRHRHRQKKAQPSQSG